LKASVLDFSFRVHYNQAFINVITLTIIFQVAYLIRLAALHTRLNSNLYFFVLIPRYHTLTTGTSQGSY